MGLILNGEGSSSAFKPVPPGMHLARCYRIVDLGTQTDPYGAKPKIMLQFEVHSEDEDGNPLVTTKGEPMTISKNFNAYIRSELSGLRKQLVSWRGREFTADELKKFDLRNVLNQWAMLSIVKEKKDDGREYTNIVTINPVPPNIKKAGLPEPYNEAKFFDLDDPDMELYDSFSDNLKNRICASPEWQSRTVTHQTKVREDSLEDDVPF